MQSIFFFIYFLILTSLSLGSNAQDKPPIQDNVIANYIKTVQLYAVHDQKTDLFSLPIIELNSRTYLQLEFDVLEEDANNYEAKIIHCNANWTPSNLLSLQYLKGYNETLIENYEFPSNTQVIYTHYWMRIPSVKRSGNYVLAVYHEDDENSPLFTKRFAVVENQVIIHSEVRPSYLPQYQNKKQRIKFAVQANSFELKDPYSQLSIQLYQNNNWKSMNDRLKPTRFQFDLKRVIYDHFTGDNEYFGGNEYRFFDLRSLDFNGMNVSKITKIKDQYHAFLAIDKDRTNESYAQLQDLNGNYFISNTDINQGLIESDYIQTHFRLKSPFLGTNKPVYVLGSFNNYDESTENLMSYNVDLKEYQFSTLLKQGFYNFRYASSHLINGGNLLEGNHYETSNDYYILVYFKELGDLSERLIGFQKISYSNGVSQ